MKPIVKLIPKKSMMVLLLPQLLIVGCQEPKHMSEEDLISMRDSYGQNERMHHPETYKPYNGKVVQYYPNDQKKKESEGSYKNGKRDSLWTFWNKDGKKKETVTYRDGIKDGIHTTYYLFKPYGKKVEQPYKDGKIEREGIHYHDNGQKEWEVIYKDDIKIMTYWYFNGRKKEEHIIRNSKLISVKGWDIYGNELKMSQMRGLLNDTYNPFYYVDDRELKWHPPYEVPSFED